MRNFPQTIPKSFLSIDRLLRGQSNDPALGILIAAGLAYGAVMGSFGGLTASTALQMLFSAAKVPLLLLATFGLSLPSFFVLNTLVGLRPDFHQVLRALIATQAALTVILASLAPFTALWYLSIPDYPDAILFNAAMFTIASCGAQTLLRRSYRPLIARNPRHRPMLRAWLALYAFVGIQMGWVLRPFIGNPRLPPRFLRSDALTNAYVFVSHLIWQKLR
jgi:hypothetical protein